MLCSDSVPAPQIGNERMPGHSDACPRDDCVEAFFAFAMQAQAHANKLKLGQLPLVLALFAWGLFENDAADAALQKEIVQRAWQAGLTMQWDQHVNGMAVNDPYEVPKGHFTSFPWGFAEMGTVTAQWQAEVNTASAAGKARTPDGVRTVVFEENGAPGWQQGLNLHNLARALGHAQNVMAFQRVPGPRGKSQVTFVGQADCLQAYQQNHDPGCVPGSKDAHPKTCNQWDQGTVFFDQEGRIWGQPTYWASAMLSRSHQPLVVNVTLHYNASIDPPAPPAPLLPPPQYAAPLALDVHALRSARLDKTENALIQKRVLVDLFYKKHTKNVY